MFWGNILVLNLMVPLVMLMMGMVHLIRPPVNRNWLYGYCTRRSTKSQESWEFAQRYFGKTCSIWGIAVCFFVCALMLLVLKKEEAIIRCVGSLIGVAEGIIMISAFMATERILKKKFDV